MFDRIHYTWSLMGASWRVLQQDKGLLIFPLLSGICCVLVLLSFATPMFVTETWAPEAGASAAEQVGFWAIVFAFYFCNYCVITFFNTALIACAIARMAGGEPSVAGGFREAMNRIHLIVGWALVAATVGLILRMIESYSEKVGQIVAGLLGMGWTVLTFVVVPVMVVENKGPIDALKSSASLLRKTWGEQLLGRFSFGLLFFLLGIPGFILIGVGVYLGMAVQSLALAIILIGAAVIYFIILALVQSALAAIFQAAVYMHTQDIHTPEGFPVRLLQGAMQQK